AKLILASCPKNGIVLDPFLGSGTTSVVAKKLGRKYIGIEINEEYCCWAEKRLVLSDTDTNIQGYSGGIFWERNTMNIQMKENKKIMQEKSNKTVIELFSEVI
ncbi:MAG: site-specific DNA-methyltransferase, partial [Treponema sp.]|nr:site-specific DNA-methyltransferase [Treponema sp.]